jgi:hypothetical protein
MLNLLNIVIVLKVLFRQHYFKLYFFTKFIFSVLLFILKSNNLGPPSTN